MNIARPGTDGWLACISGVASRMGPSSMDHYFQIGLLTQIMLTVQDDGEDGLSWHVRWVTNDFTPIESYHCTDVLVVIAAVATILDHAGVKATP